MDDLVHEGTVEDLSKCLEDSRHPKHGDQVAILVGNAELSYQRVVIDDLEPTGEQVLAAAGLRPVDKYLLFVFEHDGVFEEIRLDETVDLWERRITRFVAFESERSFRLVLDDRRVEWGQDEIRGRVLKILAGVDPKTHGVWLERRDEPDILIGDNDAAHLSGDELERFRIGPLFYLCLEGTFHPWPRETITTEEIAALGGWDPSKGVIEVDKDQNERQLAPEEIVTLKPGMSYGKRLKWKRGK